MKFAVVEYTSKSGKVWHHTAEKPNYLADPNKEMDPTSFGCYVSAMEGEHIPLKGLIVGPVQPVNFLQAISRKIVKRLTGTWPQSYDISYLANFDALLIVHQMSDAHEIVHLMRRLRQLPSRPLVIGVPTQPFGLLEVAWQKNGRIKKDLQEFMDQCDVFVTLVASTLATWQSLSRTPTVYLPQPYPVEYASAFATDLRTKQPIIFVAGVTDRPNIALGQRVAAQLQKEFPDYTIHITDTPDTAQDVSQLQGAKYEIQPFLPWQKQLTYMSQVRLVINTDFTHTRGRVQVDCAAVGTPSLGSNSDGQIDLFPTLAATEATSVDELIVKAKRLLTDDLHYNAIVDAARQNLTKLNYRASADRLRLLVKTHTA